MIKLMAQALSKNSAVGALALFAGLALLGFGLQTLSDQFHWPGYMAMVFFYSLMFFIGSRSSKSEEGASADELILAGRSLPLGVALLTMTATWVGGGFINGTAESVATWGLAWAQAPWGYALSLVVGGMFFAKKMRSYRYTTLLDPFEDRYGPKMAALLYLPALLGEVFWTGAVLTALGTTFGTILGVGFNISIILSALVAIVYTALGGMRSVANTDVLQLAILIVGLYLAIPFILPQSMDVTDLYASYQDRVGPAISSLFPPLDGWRHPDWGDAYFLWWDYALLLIFGGIPWHVYFQRVLSSKTPEVARWLSIGAGGLCLAAAFPAVVFGMVGAVTDWGALGLAGPQNSAVTLPYILQHLTPALVATIGLGALASAVMSSADSSILSASSLGAWNIYRPFFAAGSDQTKISVVLRRLVWVIGIAATLIALKIKSVYTLWFLCSDFVYCILFPQLVLALFDKKTNTLGSLAGFVVALFLRLGGGEETLGLSSFLPYPMVDDEGGINFPFRTFAMTSSFLTIMLISRLTKKYSSPMPLVKREGGDETNEN